MPSMCSLCSRNEENSFHLFFECIYSCNLWCWLSRLMNIPLHFNSIEDIWLTSNKYSNQQSKLVVNSAVINIINAIWFARNQLRFNNKKIHRKSSIASVMALVSLAGNNSKTTSLSMLDFSLLKKFNISLHPPRAPKVIEVIWYPPVAPWIKCNTDGCFTTTSSSCGGIFRNSNSDMIMCFVEKLDVDNAFQAELIGAIELLRLLTITVGAIFG